VKWFRFVVGLVLALGLIAYAARNGDTTPPPAGPTPAVTVPAVDTTPTVDPLPTCPDNDDQCELARVAKALSTPAPGEDELIQQIHDKYGPSEIMPGESGASWCHRQRLMTLMAGGGDPETIRQMGCQVDGVNYPDPVLSPDAATDWH
jgi:hypothetical protein